MFSSGSIQLFRLFGINVYLHWSWLVIALIEVQTTSRYHSMVWNAIEYLTLFAIVLTHEFGHALACRSVGGRADTIVLWPLGGIAFVQPPPRPGPVLWSIAAGPLVNVILVPVTLGAAIMSGVTLGDFSQPSNLTQFLFSIALINFALLVFNMLPIFPLDGGQIFQAILWFFIGYRKSLQVAATIGIIAAILVGLLCLATGEWMLVIMAVFLGSQAFQGLQISRKLAEVERREGQPASPAEEMPKL